MLLNQTTENVLLELSSVLGQVEDTSYSKQSINLSGATIGQHVRHVIELFQSLLNGYENGIVNYEKRKRDIIIETDKEFAIQLINDIIASIYKEDKTLNIETALGTEKSLTVLSNYKRELLYNLEHAIHHMALIRVGIIELCNIPLPETFGVAPSTIQYRKTCAQ